MHQAVKLAVYLLIEIREFVARRNENKKQSAVYK